MKTGDVYIIDDNETTPRKFVVVQTGKNLVCLLELGGQWNRWREPVKVVKISDITKKEQKEILGTLCKFISKFKGKTIIDSGTGEVR